MICDKRYGTAISKTNSIYRLDILYNIFSAGDLEKSLDKLMTAEGSGGEENEEEELQDDVEVDVEYQPLLDKALEDGGCQSRYSSCETNIFPRQYHI